MPLPVFVKHADLTHLQLPQISTCRIIAGVQFRSTSILYLLHLVTQYINQIAKEGCAKQDLLIIGGIDL